MSALITFEGTEGAGKSTQVGLAAEHLASRGLDPVVTREPGGTAIGNAVRRILLDPAHARMTATTELLLVCAARAQHVVEVIRPALQEGRVVLCDRFEDSTVAYQGHGRRLPLIVLERLSPLAAMGVKPSLTFLLDLPVEEGLRRVRGRPEGPPGEADEGRIDREEMEFHRRVRKGYLAVADEDPDRFRILDATEPAETIAGQVAGALDELLT